MSDLPSRVHLSFFASFMSGTQLSPLSVIPLTTLIARAEAGVTMPGQLTSCASMRSARPTV